MRELERRRGGKSQGNLTQDEDKPGNTLKEVIIVTGGKKIETKNWVLIVCFQCKQKVPLSIQSLGSRGEDSGEVNLGRLASHTRRTVSRGRPGLWVKLVDRDLQTISLS